MGWISQNYKKVYHKTYLKIVIRSDLEVNSVKNICVNMSTKGGVQFYRRG